MVNFNFCHLIQISIKPLCWSMSLTIIIMGRVKFKPHTFDGSFLNIDHSLRHSFGILWALTDSRVKIVCLLGISSYLAQINNTSSSRNLSSLIFSILSRSVQISSWTDRSNWTKSNKSVLFSFNKSRFGSVQFKIG